MRRRFVLVGSFALFGCSSGAPGALHPDASPGVEKDASPTTRADAAMLRDAGTGSDTGVDAISPKDAVAKCDPSNPPSEAPCSIDEAYGVFVAPGGSDTGAGTRTSPYGDIGFAIANAGAKRVYVCGATYTSPLALSVGIGTVSVYGGLACPHGDAGTSDSGVPAWSYTGDPALVAPTTPGYALTIQGVTSSVSFEDVSFTALSAVDAGAASIAVFVSGSSDVSFTRIRATAGTGAAGSDGMSLNVECSASNWCGTAAQTGGAGQVKFPGAGGTCQCAQQSGVYSYGGGGGVGGPMFGDAGEGGDGGSFPPVASPSLQADGRGGQGANLEANRMCAPGKNGGNGGALDAAAPGAIGVLGDAGWQPRVAQWGGIGNPGQGGGGGGGMFGPGVPQIFGVGGGGGSAGGCGGLGAGGGSGGGASFAIASVNSTIRLGGVTLVSESGGAGGAGGSGEPGQSGGVTLDEGPCGGGMGGAGAGGGGGGGGAGGPSAGVAYVGGSVFIQDAAVGTLTDALPPPSRYIGAAGGAAGAGGAGGDAGAPGANAGARGTLGSVGYTGAVVSANPL